MSTKRHDRKEGESNDLHSTTEQQFQREQQQAVNKALDETRDNIKKRLMKQGKKFHVIHKLLTIIRKIQYKLLEKLQTIL
jgi:hypothetical protein